MDNPRVDSSDPKCEPPVLGTGTFPLISLSTSTSQSIIRERQSQGDLGGHPVQSLCLTDEQNEAQRGENLLKVTRGLELRSGPLCHMPCCFTVLTS